MINTNLGGRTEMRNNESSRAGEEERTKVGKAEDTDWRWRTQFSEGGLHLEGEMSTCRVTSENARVAARRVRTKRGWRVSGGGGTR